MHRATRMIGPFFFSFCDHANQGEKSCITRINVLYDFVNVPSSCQSLSSTAAVALTNRSMDLFQAQVLSNLKCTSSSLWNNHSLWGSYCPHYSTNYAREYTFTCFPMCRFPRRPEYCCLLLSLQVPAAGIRKATCKKALDFKTDLEGSIIMASGWAASIRQVASDLDKSTI